MRYGDQYLATSTIKCRILAGFEILPLDTSWQTKWVTKGYYRTRLSKDKHITEYEIHRLVAQEFVPKPNVEHKLVVDHIDRNKLNNQVSNLRYVSYSQNHVNSSKRSRITTSKYKGVSWNTRCKKWRAKLVKDRRAIYLGAYDSEVDAARAYNERAIA